MIVEAQEWCVDISSTACAKLYGKHNEFMLYV